MADTPIETRPVWLESEPFPYQQIRDVLDIAAECIVQYSQTTIAHVPTEKRIARAKRIDDYDKDFIRDYTSRIFPGMNQMGQEELEGYTRFWNIIWDTCQNDQVTAAIGTQPPEKDSDEEFVLKVFQDLYSPYTQETILESAKLMRRNQFKEMFDFIYKREFRKSGVIREEFVPEMKYEFEEGLEQGKDDAESFLQEIKEFNAG